MSAIRRIAIALSVALAPVIAAPAAHAEEIFGSTTFTLLRGSAPGDFPGQYYGGSFPGVFPVVLSDAQARTSVVGAPDGQFLTLPGSGTGTPGTAFTGAYVEIGFGTNFGPDRLLNLWELGAEGESAQLFLWANNGGNVQLQVTRGASDVLSVDLSAYAGALAGIGGTSFTKVGIGGLDQFGGSKGFDLDAVSIATVPEPSSVVLLGAALGLLGWTARRRARAG